MPIEHINLRQRRAEARLRFDTQLAETLASRPDLTHAQIQKEFGISQKVIRRVQKQFRLVARRPGRKLAPASTL